MLGARDVLQLVVSGLGVGAVYALIAVGFVTIYSVTRIINFAQGDFAMVGAMMASTLVARGWSTPWAALVAVLVTMVLGGVSYRTILFTQRGSSEVTPIILTIGLAIVLQALGLLIWGPDPRSIPSFSSVEVAQIGGAGLSTQSFWIFGIMIAVMALLHLFFEKTYLGTSLRAAMGNPTASRLVGLNPSHLGLLSFALSAGLAAVAGITITPMTFAQYNMGLMLGLKGFSAAVIGGLTNSVGAVVGGLLLGVLEAVGAGLVSSAYKDALAFLLLIMILLVRPSGLFAPRAADRV